MRIVSLSVVIGQKIMGMSEKLNKIDDKSNKCPKWIRISVVEPIKIQDESRYEKEDTNEFDEEGET